jgi:hypothetical protein
MQKGELETSLRCICTTIKKERSRWVCGGPGPLGWVERGGRGQDKGRVGVDADTFFGNDEDEDRMMED